jgi:hypothetical protein
MIGGYFDEHPWGTFDAPIIVEDPAFPGMKQWPPAFTAIARSFGQAPRQSSAWSVARGSSSFNSIAFAFMLLARWASRERSAMSSSPMHAIPGSCTL